MIRIKAKNLLLSIALIVASLCFFACKETKAKVESISFTEQTISMLVGEEYSPDIKILPSYATERSYTLISEDVTALKVEGGTITALKTVAGGVRLKVVSNENSNINDVITVNIYAEAIDLQTPTNLVFDGNKFSFRGGDEINVSSYKLKIGENEIDIGNNTEYTFDNVVSKCGDLYNTVVTCSIKAVGDGRIFKDSNCSEEISFVKLRSVNNAYIEDEILYFDGIENIGSYNIDVLINESIVETKTLNNLTFEQKQLSLDISDLTDAINGKEYELKISPNVDSYNYDGDIDVFESKTTKINYTILGKVNNVNINDKFISWNFVKNAQSYTVEFYKNGSLLEKFENIEQNYLTLGYEDVGQYYCQVIANSTNENTLSGKEYSNRLNFEILTSPELVVANNIVNWINIENAEGYLVTIKDSRETAIVDKKFVLQNSYDVSGFGAGLYSIEVMTCGNGQDILSSTSSTKAEWIVLNGLQLSIEDKKLYWVDEDENSLNKYNLKFSISSSEEVDKVLTSEDYGTQYYFDAEKNAFVYDLSIYDFEPNAYTISVQSMGNGNVFDADEDTLTIIKLADSSIQALTNKQFAIAPAENGVSYKIVVYNAGDIDFVTPITSFETMLSGNKFDLNDSLLGAGKYAAKVFTYGNGKDILDADNGNLTTLLQFEKLATPTIDVDKANLKLTVQEIANAVSYKLFENNEDVNIQAREYLLNGLMEGEYTYTAQAIGNNATILDSNVTIVGNEINIKKLANSTINFDKATLIYSIECVDDAYVDTYHFTLNSKNMLVVDNKVDASAVITVDGNYVAEVYTTPIDNSDDYDLIIKSNVIQHNVAKLAGECDFKIENGKLIVTPNTNLSGTGYSIEVTIENGNNDIIISDFEYTSSRFETVLYDENYNLVNEDIATLLQNPAQYQLFVKVSQDNGNVVTSNMEEITDKLVILGRVGTIAKNGETIEFNIVANATNYIAVIKFGKDSYYIDLAGQYTTSTTKNVLEVSKLIELMQTHGVEYKEGEIYSISFVALNNDDNTLANKGVVDYQFEFLKAPVITIVELEDSNAKYIAIENNNEKVSIYNILLTQGEISHNAMYMKLTEQYNYINLDEITKFVAGEINIAVKAKALDGNYFESKNTSMVATKLDSVEINITNGVLEWSVVNNAKQYNLAYTVDGVVNVVELYDGVENFTIDGGMCKYDFDGLGSGLTDLYIQVDSLLEVSGKYYLNSNNGQTFVNVYKLPTLDISIKNGQICTEIRNSDLTLIDRIEIMVNNEVVDIDITTTQDNITVETSTNAIAITINPVILLKYGVSELLLENITLKLYSNNSTTLNSSVASKEVYGLLAPAGLDITTSTNIIGEGVIDEVFEKITWSNPRANSDYVAKYEVVITYQEIEYIFNSIETAFMMPTYYDADGNGKFDEGEVEFGAGTYTIKVRALTDNCTNIANSKFCEEISVIVLSTPTDLSIKDGNIIWSSDINVEYYLIKVYLLNSEEQNLLVSSQSKVSEFDLCNLNPFETGIYGITIQAMHNNSRILASKESEVLQAIRLPQVESYFIKDGELYINAHAFYTKAEICLTDKQTGSNTYLFEIDNKNNELYNTFTKDIDDWNGSTILDTYTDEAYFVKAKYVGDENDATLRTALAEAYSVKVKLFGNTAIKCAILSGHENEAINQYWEDDDAITDKNLIKKLVTPTIEVSELERGMLLLSIPDGLNYSSLSYYIDGENSLQGVHLYQLNVMADKKYTLYIAEVVDEKLLSDSLMAIGSSLIQDGEDKNYLKHFEYNGYTFNVVDNDEQGYIRFNFNVNTYYYYTPTGNYNLIDLSDGGSFVVNVRFLGDDTQFVQSNLSIDATIKRYKVLNLTINNGAISWLNQATVEDHPIYLVTLSNETEIYNLVLYNPNIYSKEDLMSCLDSNKTYIFDTITYSIDAGVEDEYITYTGLADIIYKSRKEIGSELVTLGGVFLASIQAHYTDNSATDIILAQGAESKTIEVLPQTQIAISDGNLSWNLAYVTTTGGREYIYNYLLQVFDENNNQLYKIALNSGMYNTSGNVVTYELPKQLNNGEDDGFTFVDGASYVFKLTALAGNNTAYINSIVTTTSMVNLLSNVQDVKMENGKLTWTNSTTNSVEIYITYKLGDANVVYTTLVTTNNFELPKSFTDTTGTYREFIAGYDYSIKVRLHGNDSSLNSFFSEELVAQRLATVKTESIVTKNGVLTWEASTIEGVKYTIKYTLEDLTSAETEMLESNEFDFADLPRGVIKVQLLAHHNTNFTSFISEQVTLFKLDIPTNIKFNEGTTTISWDKVLDADGNEVDNYMVSIRQQGIEDIEYKCTANKWVITGLLSNSFEIAVRAISVDESGHLINSDYTSYQSMEQPKQVDVTTFEFDEELQAFKWKAIDGEQEGDKYYITYNYFAPNSETPSSIEPIEVTSYELVQVNEEKVKYYYYYPSVIGKYGLIYVQVVRAGSLSSQPTYCMGDEGTYILDFNLFTSGDGVNNPYIISSEAQLRNIKYFLNANYQLDANISLSSSKPITDSNQVFTGTINGNGKYIYGVASDTQTVFDQSGYIGLFNKVSGATFKNIQLSGFDLNGYLSASTLYMGILVGHSAGLQLQDGTIRQTVFDNIVITSSKINLTKDNQNGYISDDAQMYVGAIAGYAENSKFNNCTINLGNTDVNIRLWIKGSSSTKISLGAIVGYASDCEISNNKSGDDSIAFVVQYTLTAVYSYVPKLNLGALVGEAVGENVLLSGNSCEYIVYTSQGNTTNSNEIGNKN